MRRGGKRWKTFAGPIGIRCTHTSGGVEAAPRMRRTSRRIFCPAHGRHAAFFRGTRKGKIPHLAARHLEESGHQHLARDPTAEAVWLMKAHYLARLLRASTQGVALAGAEPTEILSPNSSTWRARRFKDSSVSVPSASPAPGLTPYSFPPPDTPKVQTFGVAADPTRRYAIGPCKAPR